ncbi:MAG: hypothetical protein F6K31_07245 [Symploca sp. SIO2G7]|nr:hypothetical protein [Symploca sp. SIO2G7]
MLQQIESVIHGGTPPAALPQGINPDYIAKHIGEFNQPDATFEKREDVLFRIGSHCDVFDNTDYRQIHSLDGRLTSQLSYKVLEWVLTHTEHDIEGNLTLHIFSQEQLRAWYDESKKRYPDFELVLVFEEGVSEEFGNRCIYYTCYYRPLPSAPGLDEGTDFPVGHFEWEVGEYFWGEGVCHEGVENNIDFTMECYPEQADFSIPNTPIAPHLLTLTEEEQGHQSVAELLGITPAAV